MNKIALFIFSIFFGIAYQTSAQNYEGQIDQYPIYFQVYNWDSEYFEAVYFYKNQLKNIHLSGEIKNGEIKLKSLFHHSDTEEYFQLHQELNTLTGIWKKGNKTLNVELYETNTEFEKLKQSKMEFVRGKTETFGEKEIVWITEKHAQLSWFRLGNGFTQAQREYLNPILDKLQKEDALMGLDCYDFVQSIELVLATEEMLSFKLSTSSYCGGAHPNHTLQTFNFDIVNQLQIKSLDLLYPHFDFYELVRNKYLDDDELEKECDFFSEWFKENWEYVDWVLTPKGIEFTPDYPHVGTPCEIPLMLNYEEIR